MILNFGIPFITLLGCLLLTFFSFTAVNIYASHSISTESKVDASPRYFNLG